jgi:anaerobic magnesium-protoporphyrin IX monomethyl ester cyclase
MASESSSSKEPAVDAVFVGAEVEENLSIRTLTAAVRERGFSAVLVPFNNEEDEGKVAAAVLGRSPALVGLSVAFQHRAGEFLRLARTLREEGYTGHICAGGHFPTATAEELLRFNPQVDTVMCHDGIETIGRIMERVGDRHRLEEVPGLAFRAQDASIRLNAPPGAVRDLDRLPWPVRDGSLHVHVGRKFTTLFGSLGCYGNCSFCAINSYCRTRPGPRLRFRSPKNLAEEMARLYHERDARIFCFHDDTFLLPHPGRTMARMEELSSWLKKLGVGKIAVVAKARPDAVTRPLIESLVGGIGLIRLYLGVENFSPAGLENLGRRIDRETIDRALEACTAAGVYCCYNILMFEPDTVLDDIEENIHGMETYLPVPFNFSRTEAYNGTALWSRLRAAGRLRGNYLYTNYEIADPSVEALFGIVAQAFKDRNFGPEALANLNSSLGYEARVLEHFLEGDDRRLGELQADVRDLMTRIGRHSLMCLREALAFVRGGGWKSRKDRVDYTIELSRKVNFEGTNLHARLLELRQGIHALSSGR